MIFIGRKLLLCFVVLQSLVSGVFCCLCTMIHPQNNFCGEEFVLKVHTVNGTTRRGHFAGSYHMDFWASVMAVYKGDTCKLNFQDCKINLVFNHCGFPFMKENESYLIFGSATPSGQLTPVTCGNNMKWSKVTHTMKKRLAKKTQYTCDCLDALHYNGYGNSKYSWFCYDKHSWAEKVFGRCTMKTDNSIKKCLQ